MTELAKILSPPVVTSTANPEPTLLLHIRAIVQRHPEVALLFEQYDQDAKGIEWLRDMVALRVTPYVVNEFGFDQIVQTCQYLADEYRQLGDGHHLVSTLTGKVEAVLTEEDFYDPEKLSRYSGEQVQPLRRLRPALEVALKLRDHERGREQATTEILVARAHQTQLLREDGDPRLWIATRNGRSQIAQELGSHDPVDLLGRSGGTTGRFLQHFHITHEPPMTLYDLQLEGTLSYESQLNIQDLASMSVQHDRLGTLKGTVPQGWIRDLCRSLAEAAYTHYRPPPFDVSDLDERDIEGTGLWIADPDEFRAILRINPKVQAVPVPGVSLVGLTGQVGVLEIPSDFSIHSQERFESWQIKANLPYKLHVSWAGVRVLSLFGVPKEALLV